MNLSPILMRPISAPLESRLWILGKIEDHIARLLSKEEIKAHIAEFEKTKADLERANDAILKIRKAVSVVPFHGSPWFDELRGILADVPVPPETVSATYKFQFAKHDAPKAEEASPTVAASLASSGEESCPVVDEGPSADQVDRAILKILSLVVELMNRRMNAEPPATSPPPTGSPSPGPQA